MYFLFFLKQLSTFSMTNHFAHLSSALGYILKKHVHFTTPDLVSFSDSWHCGYQSDSVQILLVLMTNNTINVSKIWTHFLFLQNAYKCSCSPRKVVVKVVPELPYTAMTDSLRQQFYPKLRQAGQDRKISNSHRKSCPICEKSTRCVIREFIKPLAPILQYSIGMTIHRSYTLFHY